MHSIEINNRPRSYQITSENMYRSTLTTDDIREVRRFKAFMQRMGYKKFTLKTKGRTITNF